MNFTRHETRLRVGHDKIKDNDSAVTLINIQVKVFSADGLQYQSGVLVIAEMEKRSVFIFT